MKILWILGLIISISGQGEVPEEGLELTINEAEENILTGEMQMNIDGTLLSDEPLSVTITRSASGLKDEFCCAGQCIAGNGEKSEILHFTPGGLATWFSHYTPAPDSKETITYLFVSGSGKRTVTVNYDYTAQALEDIQTKTRPAKIIRDGQVLIMREEAIYTTNGINIK